MKSLFNMLTRSYALLFSVLLFSACAQSQSKNPEINNLQGPEQVFYLRGGFNNWGVKAPFTAQQDGTYQVIVEVGLGIHEYKIANKDWQSQYMIANRELAVVDIQKPQPKEFLLAKNSTEDADLLLVERAGQYQFILHFDAPQSMRVSISRIGDLKLSSNISHNPKTKIQLPFPTVKNSQLTTSFSIVDVNDEYKHYVHSTTQALRDPVPQINQFKESSKWPVVRSGNIAFDGLFALAIDEMQLNSVTNINDGTYNNGQSIACDCFKTGEKWDYVWTRDLSYAAHLSLSSLDPQRVKNSLLFKLSGYRKGVSKPAQAKGSDDGIQIIQDTGSGGSWPISSDRVTWAFGAQSTLNNLFKHDRSEFAKTSFLALTNTLENDRLAAFDHHLGLYTGEQSFLDWREQTYADWIKDDLSFMATSISISTNAAHYQAITLAQRLALELNKPEQAARYQFWAEQLKININKHLWLDNYGLYSSLTAGHFDKVAMPKFDWLGQSLAIITGIADEKQTQSILANYPHGPMGAPVIFPQQPNIRIYHNRSIWPFVTAYGLQAAIKGNNVSVANQAFDTLIRSAALNLSNMENLEWLSGESIWLERQNLGLSGPVINSKHQLWSVAGYLNMVIEGVFGVQPGHQGLTLSPYVTTELRERFFAGQSQIGLNNFTWQQHKINVTIKLPSNKNKQQTGVYIVRRIELNGQALNSNVVTGDLLNREQNEIIITLAGIDKGNTEISLINANPTPVDNNVFSPLEPNINVTAMPVGASIEMFDEYNNNVSYNIYRNSQLIAENVKGKVYVDQMAVEHQACYSVSAIFTDSKHQSHHSQIKCVNAGQVIMVDDDRVNSNISTTRQGTAVSIVNFGSENDHFNVNNIVVNSDGEYAFQLHYSNKYNKTNTGITAGVKWLTVLDTNGDEITSGVIQMPHIKADNSANFSTPLVAKLNKGNYQVVLTDFYNMSYLTNNQTYSQAGGQLGAVNKFDIFALRILPISR